LRTSPGSTFYGALLALAAGCSSPPAPSPQQRLEGALTELRDLFACSEDSSGKATPDREVVSIHRGRIRYATHEGIAELRWADVDGVGAVLDRSQPEQRETLFVYLRAGSPSAASASDAQRGADERPFLRLAERPPGSRARLERALKVLERSTPALPAEQPEQLAEQPEQPAAEPAEQPDTPSEHPGHAAEQPDVPSEQPQQPADPSVELPDEPPKDEGGRAAWVEARLARLKAWHEQGLLDDTEYAAEKQRLLERW